ncbi:hypothetical protein R3P38DRAFT_2786331 [Favolaschia claudopus]|uniref:Uncharacterized protein n=1 Tax=Favolaschia claudopus TaxID=2862362 RepID=A0AAW0ATG7_9AGAR
MAEGPRPHESDFSKRCVIVVLTVAVFPAPKWGHIAVDYTPSITENEHEGRKQERNKPARSHARILHGSQDLQRPYDQISVSLGVQSVSSKILLIAWKAVRSSQDFSARFTRLHAWQPSIFLLCAILAGWKAPLAGAVYPASAAGCTGLRMACWIHAEQRDTRSCVRVVEDLIQPKRISGISSANPALQVPTCITTSTSPSRARLVTACAPRSGAYSFDYTELLPPSDILRISSREQYLEILPPAGKSRSSKLKPTLSRAMLLVEAPRSGANAQAYRFSSGERGLSELFRLKSSTSRELPDSNHRSVLEALSLHADVKLEQIRWIPKSRLVKLQISSNSLLQSQRTSTQSSKSQL